ncbi:MAG: hypothetical protein IJW02_02710 [Clostridia bacterium]|nr:hypothetical protein [Clostridia bacterium]
MKRIIAIILLLTVVLSITSCIFVPAYHANTLIDILEDNNYVITDVNDTEYDGVVGYIYGERAETEDEVYYIYCEDFASAHSIYDYINSQMKADIAELKMEIERIEYLLYKAEGVSAEEKGKSYEKYVELKEELEEIERYGCGRGFNVVWYGTDKAIMDLRLG